jgi:hypothetical protein
MDPTTHPPGPAATRAICAWDSRAVRIACAGVAIVTLFRLWYCCCTDLIPDEAYYWVWSKHLALSYRDKGPLVAWTIALGTWLFGDTVFGVRFFAVLLSAGTAFQLFQLARRLYDDRTALWCLAAALAIPLFSVGSILMTIDPLSVFFWAWGANLSWRAFETGKTRYWALLGLAVGAGFLAKFVNAMQLLCVALFLCWSRPHRRFLVSRQSLAALVGFAVSSFPLFLWNAQTGWLHLVALNERGGFSQSFVLRPHRFFQYVGAELGVISPLLLVGMVVAVIGLWRSQSAEPRVKHLLSQFLPVQVMYLLLSLTTLVEPNWIAPSLIAGIVLMVAYWRQVVARSPRWRWVTGSAVGLGLLISISAHSVIFLRLPVKLDLMRRAEGWTDFALHIQQAREDSGADLLIGNHYSQASMMRFYLPDHPVTYLAPAPYGTSQFTLWPGYEIKPGTRALFVADGQGLLPQKLKDAFDGWQLLDDFWSAHRGRPTTHFRVYLLTKN